MNSILKARLFFALELTLLLCIVLTVTLPFIPVPGTVPSRDSGVFLYVGWRILHGEVPYLDIWDHKTPVIYYLDALGLLLTPDSALGVWMVEVVSLGIAAAFGYFLIKKIFGLLPAAFLSFNWLFTGYYLFVGGNLTTEYALPFQFALLWLFYRAESRSRYGWYGFALGAVTALLFFTRQNAIAIPLAIGLYLLVSRLLRRAVRQLWSDSWPILAGGLLVTGLVLGYFAAQGALADFWDQAIRYNFAYTDERTNADRFSALLTGMDQLINVGLAPLALTGWGAALLLLLFKRERFLPETRALLCMALMALPFELWLVSLGGRPRIPYFMTLLPVFALLAGVTVWLIFDNLLKDIPAYAGAGLVVLMVFALWLTFSNDYAEIAANNVQDVSKQEIAAYIQENTAPDDLVLMWGAETAYNFVTRRRSPTRYVYQYPLYKTYANEKTVTEFLDDIYNHSPRLIIMQSNEKLTDFRMGYRNDRIGNKMDQIKARYSEPVTLGNWLIYTLQVP